MNTPAVRAGLIFLLLSSLYLLNVSYNLHCFYIRGAGDDSGWFAWLATNARAWPMPNPDVIGGNYLSIHMSLVFFASTVLLLPLSGLPTALQFCLVISLWARLLWLGLFLLLDRFPAIGFVRRCVLALLLTFNGLMLSMLGFPHIEMLIPALGLLAIATWLRAWSAAGWASAVIIILFVLAIREDAGLHLSLVLLAMALVSMWMQDTRSTRRLMALAVLSLAGSLLALWLQRNAGPDGGQQLGNVYFGHPPLSHVSAGSLARRSAYWITRRECVFLPLLVLVVAAGLRKLGGVRLLVGVAIALPWLGLSFVAAAEQAGDLWSYYCFPLVFMAFWPLLLGQVGSPATPGLLSVQITMSGLSTAAFIAIGILPYSYVGDGGSHDRSPWTHLWPPSPAMIRLTEASLAGRGGWLFDYGAAALVFGSLQPGQFRAGLAFDDAEMRAARGFIRFEIQPRFLVAKAGAIERAFPICTSVEGTALQVCERMGPVDKP